MYCIYSYIYVYYIPIFVSVWMYVYIIMETCKLGKIAPPNNNIYFSNAFVISATDSGKMLMIFQNLFLYLFFFSSSSLNAHSFKNQAFYILVKKKYIGLHLERAWSVTAFSCDCQEPSFPCVRSVFINHLLSKQALNRHHL